MPSYKQTLFSLVLVCYSIAAYTQTTTTDTLLHRCATMEVLAKQIAKDPSLPEQWRKEGEALYQRYLQRNSATILGRSTGGTPYSTNGNEIVIPVVVHVVLPTPTLVTDRDVQEQIDILNKDFAGLNADSSAVLSEFKARFGKTRIRFALARKDANGSLTTGIERTVSSVTYTQDNYNSVKHASSNGVDAWDVTRYYNVWVTAFSDGILGVSTFPYMTPANEQGTVVNYRAFGNNTAYVSASFNMGRTLVHETGHFFYLYHIWGDDDGLCTGSDFATRSGYTLPSTCTDDTPGQGDYNSGYLGGYITDNCTGTAPGVNYQNYMDYTNDVSYAMFTTAQVCRMEAALTMYRSALAASDADIPPSGTNDICLASITPGIREGGVIQTICANTPLTGLLRNLGSNTLTTARFSIQYDGGTITTVNWTGNLLPGADISVSLGNITAGAGSHTLKVYTTLPNGSADGYTNNDTLSRNIFIAGSAVSAPLTENFESTTFPPAGWSLSNPDNSTTWLRTTTAAYEGSASARMANYGATGTIGQWDDLITPPISFNANADSAKLSFRVAYRAYSNVTGTRSDGLEVWISNDCGGNFRPIYRKSPPNLSTVSTVSTSAFTPTATQWRKDSIDLTPYLSGQNIIVLFRNVNSAGNYLYLDDINFTQTTRSNEADAMVTAVSVADGVCTGTVQPAVTIKNASLGTLRSVTINYKTDETGAVSTTTWTGSLATDASTQVSLPDVTAAIGQHQLIAWTSNPNNLTDERPYNDTSRQTFTVLGSTTAPLVEGFEQTTFPTTGWGIRNNDNSNTWQRARKATALTGTTDTAATVMRNYSYAASGITDDLKTPVVQYSKVDSVYLLFDVAALYNTSGTAADTLEVLVTSDCGATYQSVYKKGGQTLSTVTSSSGAVFVPATVAQYRRDSINLTGVVPASGQIQVMFRNTSYGQNNIYLDNINLKTRTLPAALKESGYLIYPNPTRSSFIIQHYLAPVTLTGIAVYDVAGHIVYQRSYVTGQAPAFTTIDLSRFASGMYLVRLLYTDHVLTEKLLKQ